MLATSEMRCSPPYNSDIDMQYYVESDGRVFLVDRSGTLDLPRRDEIPFRIIEIAPLKTEEDIVFCSPLLDSHPSHWKSKDEIAGSAYVSPLVRQSVHAGMPRVVVEGICLRDRSALLVRGSRGLTKGMWSLPGGFLRFGETPEAGIVREISEELNATATVEKLIGIKAKLGARSRLHWIMIFYRVGIEGDYAPNPDEIARAEFFPIEEARRLIGDDLMREALESIDL